MNIRKTTHTRSALLLLTAGSAALLAGCGGGGGNGNTSTGVPGTTGTPGTTGAPGTTGGSNTSQIVGKVTDTFGKGIPGVSIAVDTGGQIATTISTGGYRLDNLSAAVHKITAAVTLGGVQYTGSTQVATTIDPVTGGNLNSNVNILLSQVNQQATVQGYVRDTSGNPVAGASVYAAVLAPAVAASGGSGNYSSLVAFTDSNGFYQIANIPSALPSGSLSVTASSPTTANGSASITQNSLTAGSSFTQNFTLTPSTNAVADTPVIVGINAFTQPTDGLVGAALQARLVSGSGSAYEGIRRLLSPSYASFAARKRILGKRLVSRASANAYAVEIDLGFNPPAATNINLLGYDVYRTTGPIATNKPIESMADSYDGLADPLANYYTDLTASSDSPSTSSSYAGGTQYNFALSSVASASAKNARLESAISNVYSITPLSPLMLTAPTANQPVTGPVTISWTPVTGATKYFVFLYSQYPSINTIPINGTHGTEFMAGTSSATVTLTGGSATYYVIVAATTDETETATVATPVTNAAQSYSEITQFIVQ